MSAKLYGERDEVGGLTNVPTWTIRSPSCGVVEGCGLYLKLDG